VDTVLMSGITLVVMPGQTNIEGLPVVKPVFLSAATRVDELAKTYNMDIDEFRKFNALGQEPWTTADRWVVVRVTP
jgi:hypothetical protein